MSPLVDSEPSTAAGSIVAEKVRLARDGWFVVEPDVVIQTYTFQADVATSSQLKYPRSIVGHTHLHGDEVSLLEGRRGLTGAVCGWWCGLRPVTHNTLWNMADAIHVWTEYGRTDSVGHMPLV